jgi:hypothetical protein
LSPLYQLKLFTQQSTVYMANPFSERPFFLLFYFINAEKDI